MKDQFYCWIALYIKHAKVQRAMEAFNDGVDSVSEHLDLPTT